MVIVCGTDFSAGAQPALAVAAALARRLGDELLLVHALDRSIGALDDTARTTVEAAARGRIVAEASQIAEHSGVAVRGEVIPGPAYETLPAFAQQEQARFLVVSSRGHGTLAVYRLGSTSERLAQVSRVPVVVVRDAAPFEAWARNERPLRVLLGFDWTASSEAALRWVKALREVGPCDVTVGYVYYADSLGEAGRHYGLPHRHPFWERDPEVERLLARDLSEHIGTLGGTGEVVVRPKLGVGRTADHLLELAEAERADLIVVGTHRKRGLARLASVSGIALHLSHSSVACVPPADGELLASEEVPLIGCVLVPTDLSPASNTAALHAYALLQGGGEIILAHVAADNGERSAEPHIVAELRSLLSRRPSRGNVTIRTEVVRHRDVATAICELAERVGADVICMASHGRGGLERALLGSVAEAVMRQTRQPVLVVRPPHP